MGKTIVIIKDNCEKYTCSFDYVHMALHDKRAVLVYCPQTHKVYIDKTTPRDDGKDLADPA